MGHDREAFISTRKEFWEKHVETHYAGSSSYRSLLQKIFRKHVLPGGRVLELGCGTGDLLAALEPEYGVGVDFSEKAIDEARKKYPELDFHCQEAGSFTADKPFDIIILSDLLNELWDIQAFFAHLRKLCHSGTRILLNFHSRLWQPVLGLARATGLARPLLPQNWVTLADVQHIADLEDFEIVRHSPELLLPVGVPVVSSICNSFFAKLPLFNNLDLVNFMVLRPNAYAEDVSRTEDYLHSHEKPSLSVVVAARNEEGHIEEIFQRFPDFGCEAELIFVEGGSSDDTYGEIERRQKDFPHIQTRLMRQPGKGKGDAVRTAFANAKGDILMILDADLTVAPEDLPKFYKSISENRGEFINGVRLVYPMADKAMRFCNLIANKFFGLAFSWVLEQQVRDTLCGTKVLWRRDYDIIADNRSFFGNFDPFGDFDLLFGAARLNLKIVDIPVRYGERRYGDTNINRWRDGMLLFKMLYIAMNKLKFR